MKISTKILLTLAAAAALSYATPAFANFVSNGGFETDDFTDWTQFGNTGFTGVQGNFGSVAPHSGSFQAFFGPVDSTGGIFQDLTTVAGQTYNLTFWMYNFGGTPSSFSASWDGAVIPASVLVDPGAFRYTQFSFTGLVASGTSTQLAFTFQQNPSYFLLDNVTVTSGTPDGGNTLSLLGLAMVGICLIRRWAPARVK